jgi:hypothetical protein
VENADHEADRTAALDYVLQTALLDRLVPPNGETEGRIAFPAYRPGDDMTLKLPIKAEGQRAVLSLRWEVR